MPQMAEVYFKRNIRRKVHFRRLSSVYDWKKVSKEFREKYYVCTRSKSALGRELDTKMHLNL